MRGGEASSVTTYFYNIWGALTLIVLIFTVINPWFAIIDILQEHHAKYALFSFGSCVFTVFIIFTQRERVESYYFPARGYEESTQTLKATALNIWPVFLSSVACLLIYLYSYEGLAGMVAGGAATAAQRQASILLLLPYSIALSGFAATSSLIAIKEAIRASRIAYGLDDLEGTTADLTDRVLRTPASATGSRVLP